MKYLMLFMLLFLTSCGEDWVANPSASLATDSKPQQKVLTAEEYTLIKKEDAVLRPRASITLSGLVLGAKRYLTDDLSDIVPVDLALGWGKMADVGLLYYSKITITQSNRFYYWQVPAFDTLSRQDIEENSANMHMIPATAEIAQQLKNIKKSDIVQIGGLLVDIEKPGRNMPTSLTRSDTGAGACEIIYVVNLKVKTVN